MEVRAGAALSAASEPTPARKVCPVCPPRLEGLLLMMLSPTPDTRPSLATIQATLDTGM
jgi:hypothetical protein